VTGNLATYAKQAKVILKLIRQRIKRKKQIASRFERSLTALLPLIQNST
jgi:hypothetical protein